MDHMTPRQRDIDKRVRHKAKMGLEAWVMQHRPAGWDSIAVWLNELTGDTVNGETLARWYGPPRKSAKKRRAGVKA